MNKILVSSLVALVTLGANVAAAQSYYQPYSSPFAQGYGGTQYNYGTTNTVGCVNLVSDLSYGSRGSQVSQLQTFLVSQNFPGSGSWMITGNFKSATLAAVRSFQQSQGLMASGVVDAATRAAISRVSCGGYSMYNYSNTYPYVAPPFNNYLPTGQAGNNTNCYYTYPYTCNNYSYTYGNNVVLTSLSSTSGQPGTSVTIYGSGFDYSNNTVYFGMVPLTNISSYNGTSLTFTVPSYTTTGTVGISVVNTRGTSNVLNFSITSAYGCGYQTPYNSYGGYVYGAPGQNLYGYGYGYGSNYCPPSGTTPYITYLSPNSGVVGSSVTVYGSGFSAQGNTIHFGSGVVANIPSYNGTSLTFTVPSQLSGYGSQIVMPGTYNVSVSNSAGYTSGAISFTVTSSGSYGAPTISSLNGPTSLTAGVQGTWTIQVNNPGNSYMTTSVNWGDAGGGYASAAAPQTTYQQGVNTLTFTHTYYAAGIYTAVFTVSNASGQMNTSSATVNVTGTGSYGNVTLSSVSPMAGRVGTQIILTGSGFNLLDNTVRFGIGGTQHIPSFNNGTVIYYTVPSFVSLCDLVTPGSFCAQNIQQVLPGLIQVYVINNAGTTNTLMFQVTN